jgi:protocatechuate 3,4-dioxygenase beta subunit
MLIAMKRAIIATSTFICVALALGNSTESKQCSCGTVSSADTTHWGGNMEVVFVEKAAYRVLGGTVADVNGKPIQGTLVEVFTNPDYLLSQDRVHANKPEQRRVAACKTQDNGGFCFKGLPSGRYELRSSGDDAATGWNVTKVYVVVDAHRGVRRNLKVTMTVGT